MPQVLGPSAWPTRSYICLRCRSLLTDSGGCECGSTDVVELANGGRAALIDRVWGRLDHRDVVNRPAAAMMLVGGMTLGFSLLALNGFGIVVGVGSLMSGGLVRLAEVGKAEEDHRVRGSPLPAAAPPPLLPAARVFGGQVVTDEVCCAPMSLRYCVAYAAELRDDRARDTFLRDAVTIGFTLEANDGRTVVVPPGPVKLSGGRSRRILLEEQIRAYLSSCDPAWRPDRYDPFPYATAFEAVVCQGDTVELHNPLEPVHEPSPEADYRHSATGRLKPVGTPMLHVVSGA